MPSSISVAPAFSAVKSEERHFRVIKLNPEVASRLDLIDRLRCITDEMVTAINLGCDTAQLQHVVETLEHATEITANFCAEEKDENGSIKVTIHEFCFSRSAS